MNWKTFGINLGQNAISSGANALLGMGTTALSRLFGLSMSPQKSMKLQHEYNVEIMQKQAEYQKEAAAQSQQYAKDYWDYTNAENQKEHLKNAGLNPALLYGQGGGGGMGLSGGAKEAAPEQPQISPVTMGLQAQQLEQQKQMNDAQIALAEAQASKARAEAEKIGGVDIQEGYKRIEEMNAKIDDLIADKNYKEAETELSKARKATEDTIQKLNESKEALSRAQISEAFAVATYYSEMAHKVYWEFQREKLGYKYDVETLQDRIDAAYYMNCQVIASIAKTYKDIEVGDAQIKQLEAAAKELNERADKHNWDKETYRKQVEGMVERWEEQTFNERLQIGLQFGENIAKMFFKLRKKKTQTKTVSKREGKEVITESYTEFH
jgi:phosphopantetheinyl transferase (holo-ACP synthase)